MDKVSTPEEPDVDDGLDLSGEDSRDDAVDTSADTTDDDANSNEGDDDNGPSGTDDESGDDDKSTTDKASSDKTPAFDKDLDKWMEDRGYDKPENDKERRLAQDTRNSQRDFSKRSEAAASAKKIADNVTDTAKEEVDNDDDADPMAKRLATVEASLTTERQNRQISEFVYAMSEAGKPVTMAESDAMGELLAKTLKEDGKAGVDFLLKNIPRWHKLAAMDIGTDSVDTDAVSDKARKEERARIQKETNAGGPHKSAKNNAPVKGKDELTKIWEDDSI